MGHSKELNLKKIDVTKGKQLFSALIVVGLALSAAGYFQEHSTFWPAFLINYFLYTCFAIGAVFFIATQYVTKARWSVNFRRIPEAFASFLPIAAVLGLIFVATSFVHSEHGHFGAASVYHWMDSQAVAGDELLQHKAGYLNATGMFIRTLIVFAIMIFFGGKLVCNSVKQDLDGNSQWTLTSVKYSAVFLVLFAIAFSVFSYDFLMSVEPHWFSTMFPVYTFATMFYSTMALMALVLVRFYNKGYFGGYVGHEHIHDVSKLTFAFCVFWAYIAFCQFMLIWYAGIPEETFFYMKRWDTSVWKLVSLSLIVFKFFFVFFLIMSRHAKRNYLFLRIACVVTIIMALVDHFWIVYPAQHGGHATVGLSEIGLFILFGGLFGFSVSRFLGKHLLVPVKDPYVHESVEHHIFP